VDYGGNVGQRILLSKRLHRVPMLQAREDETEELGDAKSNEDQSNHLPMQTPWPGWEPHRVTSAVKL
jgi:hypothetical protein